ncbi:MAG: ribonuclease Z [Patescibacteria group bacterium]
MEITILGSGSYQPELSRHSAGYLVRAGKKNLVFDFGRGAVDQLMKVGVNYYDIDAIFITHLHSDHCSDLLAVLHILLIEPAFLSFRKKKLVVYGPVGFNKVMAKLMVIFNLTKYRPQYKIVFKEIKDGQSARIGSCQIRGYKVKHSRTWNCLAYRISANKKVLTYSGDSEQCPGLLKAARGADLAILEASWPEKFIAGGHMSASQAAALAQKAGVKRLVLSHMHSFYFRKYNPLAEAKKNYRDQVVVARDLMVIDV